jgi:aminomethyltransferase
VVTDSDSITPTELFSPLHERHVALGAKLGDFGGWLMPIEYAGTVAEHAAVRDAVGVFDVSHLGKASVVGPGAADFLNSVLTNDLGRIDAGQAQYTLLCNDTGGVIDDLIAYLNGPDDVFLIPNASNTARVVEILAAAAPAGITVTNLHRDFAVVAVQGPRSVEVLRALNLPTELDYMSFATAEFNGGAVVVCRTGYTGEHGYELVIPAASGVALWDALMAAGASVGIVPCGLGARDTLRTEMGYPLHGQDLSVEISPVQARAGWAVGWSKPAFHGRDALTAEKAAGPRRSLVGLLGLERGIPRQHMNVLNDAGAVIGEVTSGTFSPTLKQGIALALINADAGITIGSEVVVDVRGRPGRYVVTTPPFVDANPR